VYRAGMHGNTGQWGTPFTKANEMRERGLATRRLNAAARAPRPPRRTQSRTLTQPAADPPLLRALESVPTKGAPPAAPPAQTSPAPRIEVPQEICYGYELAPGVWKEAPPPAKLDLHARIVAMGEAAHLRMLQARRVRRQTSPG
jgi:hypothetical protein